MKYKNLLFALLVSLLFTDCSNPYKVTYNIPANYPEARREQLIEIFRKGKELYKINCSDCHGVLAKGKDKIPNFTYTQIDNYSTRFLKRDPKNHAVAIQMSQEQLNEVITFLRYKKQKNGDSTVTVRRRL